METRLFPAGTVPEWTTPGWYAGRDAAPHLEQGGHRERLLLTYEFVQTAVAQGAGVVVDLGAGDGGLLSLLPSSVRRWGYDLQQTNVDAAATRGEVVYLHDVVENFEEVSEQRVDCLVVTEMLEHLIDPHDFVQRLYDETDARWLVASSPFTETADAHYEYHTWAWDVDGYRKMIEDAGWHVVRTSTAWISQVILAVR